MSDPTRARTFVEQCYEQFGPELNRYLRRQLRRFCASPQDVRDLAQEVWCRLLRIKDPSEVLEPMAYIHTSALNVLREQYSMGSRQTSVLTASEVAEYAIENPQDSALEESAEELVLAEEFDRAVAALPKIQRDVLFLKVNDGRSWKDIGSKLQLTEGTAYMYFWRAMTAIRKSRQAF